jgi:hypothetical protein
VGGFGEAGRKPGEKKAKLLRIDLYDNFPAATFVPTARSETHMLLKS